MKKILVTGATGFIGNHVVQQLLQMGHTVVATSATITKAQQMRWYNRVAFIPFDLSKIDNSVDYYSFFERPDMAIHLAWEGLPNYNQAFHLESNLPRHFTFLNNLIRNGLSDLTVTGTCLEYGRQEGELKEDMAAKPDNPYAVAKDELRKRIEELKTTYSFCFKWVRLFYMWGRGQNPNSLLSQLDKALEGGETEFKMSGGEQQRDYLPIDKVAQYIAAIALQNGVQGVVNCASGKPVKVKDFVQAYLKRKDQTITLNLGYYPYTDYEPMNFWADINKLKKIVQK